MKALSLAAGFVVFSLAMGAQADEFCPLLQRPLPAGLQIPLQTQLNYRQKLTAECQMRYQYRKMGGEMVSKYGIPLEDISAYKALRFVDRGFYESARTQEIPVPLIYQKRKEQYSLPMERRSTEIWDNWNIGIRQMDSLLARVRGGYQLSMADLQQFHRGMYSVSDEAGDYAHIPLPGQLKEPSAFDNAWFRMPDADVPDTLRRVDVINARYQSLGFLIPFDASAPQKHLPLRLERTESGYYVYGGDTRANEAHLKNLVVFLNKTLRHIVQGEHIVWRGEVFTPVEAALLIQQFFVQLHPFYEGNGRISRALQELPLVLAELPHMASGDLMDIDVLTPLESYYAVALDKTALQLGKLSECLQIYEQSTRKLFGKRRPLLEQHLPYECRILN